MKKRGGGGGIGSSLQSISTFCFLSFGANTALSGYWSVVNKGKSNNNNKKKCCKQKDCYKFYGSVGFVYKNILLYEQWRSQKEKEKKEK